MIEVAQKLPHDMAQITYNESCSVALAPDTAPADDGEMSPRSSRMGHSVHHCPAWKQGEKSSGSLLRAPRSATAISPDDSILPILSSRGTMDDAIKALIDKAVREALETAAKRLETLSGNVPYEKAWRRAAREVRAYKPD